MFRAGSAPLNNSRGTIHNVCSGGNDAPYFAEYNVDNAPGVVQLSSSLLVVIDKNKSLKSSQGLGEEVCVWIERERERENESQSRLLVRVSLVVRRLDTALKRRLFRLVYLYLQYPWRSLSLYLLGVFGLEK